MSDLASLVSSDDEVLKFVRELYLERVGTQEELDEMRAEFDDAPEVLKFLKKWLIDHVPSLTTDDALKAVALDFGSGKRESYVFIEWPVTSDCLDALEALKDKLYENKYGEPPMVDLDWFRDRVRDGEFHDFDDEINQFVESYVEQFEVHKSPDGYVTVIYTYKEIAFQARCVEGDESPWFESPEEAESWIFSQGVG